MKAIVLVTFCQTHAIKRLVDGDDPASLVILALLSRDKGALGVHIERLGLEELITMDTLPALCQQVRNPTLQNRL